MTGINVKAGYLFPFSQNFRVGPYLAYQYSRFGINFNQFAREAPPFMAGRDSAAA